MRRATWDHIAITPTARGRNVKEELNAAHRSTLWKTNARNATKRAAALGGKASGKQTGEDGQVVHKANEKIRRFGRLPCAKTEARFRWMQELSRRGNVRRCTFRRTTGITPGQDLTTCHLLGGKDPGRPTEHRRKGGRSRRPHQRTGRTMDETILRHAGGGKIPEVRLGWDPRKRNDSKHPTMVLDDQNT